MKLLIALYFFILATIQLGLLLGIYYYRRSHRDLSLAIQKTNFPT